MYAEVSGRRQESFLAICNFKAAERAAVLFIIIKLPGHLDSSEQGHFCVKHEIQYLIQCH